MMISPQKPLKRGNKLIPRRKDMKVSICRKSGFMGKRNDNLLGEVCVTHFPAR